MNRHKKEDFFNHPTYDQETDKLIDECRNLIQRLQAALQNKNLDGISIVSGKLDFHKDGTWQVETDESSIQLSHYTETDVILGYWLSPDGETEPDSYFFRLTPDIKRTQACQNLRSLLQARIREVNAADFQR